MSAVEEKRGLPSPQACHHEWVNQYQSPTDKATHEKVCMKCKMKQMNLNGRTYRAVPPLYRYTRDSI